MLPEREESEGSDMERLKVAILGLTRASCVPEIEQVIREQIGVVWATVNFAAKEASIVYDPVDFDPARVARAVACLGIKLAFAQPAGSIPGSGSAISEPLPRIRQWARARHHSSP